MGYFFHTKAPSRLAVINVICLTLNRACPVEFRKADPIDDRIPPGNPEPLNLSSIMAASWIGSVHLIRCRFFIMQSFLQSIMRSLGENGKSLSAPIQRPLFFCKPAILNKGRYGSSQAVKIL
jgi:hypothetical protein